MWDAGSGLKAEAQNYDAEILEGPKTIKVLEGLTALERVTKARNP